MRQITLDSILRNAAIQPLAILFVWSLITVATAAQDSPFDKWEKDIARFEELAQEQPVKPGGVVFVGSSSIRKWDLEASFPDANYVNRGFGGSQIVDSTHFASRIILPLKPSVIVMYAGDNDIQAGKKADVVARDFQDFVATVREELPRVKIVFIAIKPSLKRWNLYPEMAQANAKISELCQSDDQLFYADIATPMIGDNEQPSEDLFEADLLHLSKKGYAIWNEVIGKVLEEL